MFIQFMDPYLFWIGVPIVLVSGLALSWYSTKAIEGARKFYGDLALLDLFTPRSQKQTRSIWAQWILFFMVLVAAAAGPNASDTPSMVRAGAVQVMFLIDVSPSGGAEDYRPYIEAPPGKSVPTQMYQWGTRIDMAKQLIRRDFLPQLKDNEVGLITVQGSGYNMWDLTRDHNGAFSYMLENFVQVGAAPGGGADFASGIQAALDEFKLIGGKDKERFIVLFSDGGFTGDKAELDKVLQELNKQNVRLLVVGLGGHTPVAVPKYDSSSKQRNGAYEGTTKYEPALLEHMAKSVKGGTLLAAPPGTEHVKYDFPAKAGGLYAVPKKSNLYFWFLIFDLLLLANITFGAGGLPKWKLVLALCLEPFTWLKNRRFFFQNNPKKDESS